MRADRRRALIIYGDITGFATWARRTMPSDFLPLMQSVYDIFQTLRCDPDLFVKFFGDGFMVVRELDCPRENEVIVGVFKKVLHVARRIERAIQATDFPRPSGFRVRAVIGPCWRIDYGDNYSERDYLGYFVNFCSRLLGIAREIKLLVSDSVRQALFAGAIRGLCSRFSNSKTGRRAASTTKT